MATWADFWGTIDWSKDSDDAIANAVGSCANNPNKGVSALNARNPQGLSGLYFAVVFDKKKTFDELLSHYVDTEVAPGIPSPLAIAFRDGKEDYAKGLIEHGANTAIVPDEGWSDVQKAQFEKTRKDIWKKVEVPHLVNYRILEKALENGQNSVAMNLIPVMAAEKVDFNTFTDGKPSALVIAIRKNNFNAVVSMLRVDNVDVNGPANDSIIPPCDTLLNEALKHLPDSKKIVKKLIKQGADVNLPGLNGKYPWEILCESMEQNGFTKDDRDAIREVAEMMMDKDVTIDGLLKKPQDVFKDAYDDIKNAGALVTVDWKEYSMLVKLGVAGKCNKSVVGTSPSYYYHGLGDLIAMKDSGDSDQKAVVDAWIEQDLAVQSDGKTATTVCFEAIESQNKNTLETYLDLGVNANASNADGDTFMHAAADTGNTVIGGLLLDNGADLNQKGKGGKTPLMRSICNQKDAFSDMLLNNKDISLAIQDNEGMTALHHAVANNDISMVKKILGKDPALVNLQDKNGNTALHVAVEKGNLAIARELITFGADINKKNKQNATPVSRAHDIGKDDFANDMKETAAKGWLSKTAKKYGVKIAGKIRCGGHWVKKVCRVLTSAFKPRAHTNTP